MSNRIYLIGCPSDLGGADTEAWHAIRIFQARGMDVHVIPTWQAPNSRWTGPPGWDDVLRRHNFRVHAASPDKIHEIEGLAGSLVISFCNGNFMTVLPKLNQMGCKTIWLNCMTFSFDSESVFAEPENQPSAWVMQSDFQMRELLTSYAGREVPIDKIAPRCRLIRGAFRFDHTAVSPRPHPSGSIFTFGRLARPDTDKWSSNTWKIYSNVQYANKAGIVMGVNDAVKDKLGDPPEFVGCLPANAIPAHQFLQSLHCLLPINGGARENWPRVGLEAFAAGVPVVTQNLWGWAEMIDHGRTGFLANNDEELAHYTAALAYDEVLRLRIIESAHRRLRDEFSDSDYNWGRWESLFNSLS